MNTPTTSGLAERVQGPGAGRRVYLIGVGGAGMCPLAHLLLDAGWAVAGSDLVESVETTELRARGATVHIQHLASQIAAHQPEWVIHSTAIRPDNPELQWAQNERRPLITRRGAALAALMLRYDAICVAGMHGKSTTAAWLTYALSQLGAQPSYAIGARAPQLGPPGRLHLTPARPGLSPGHLFVAESDESDGTLVEYLPSHAILLNLDADHLDYFLTLESIQAEFRTFAQRVSGHLVYCADDPALEALFSRHPGAVSHGFGPAADYRVEPKPRTMGAEATLFEVWHQGQSLGSFRTRLIGRQNLSNVTAVIALLHRLGFPLREIAQAIAPFDGVDRRQHLLHRDQRVQLFEDYGHHPAEIRATLAAFRTLAPRRLLVAFQPHRFSRTRHLLADFTTCFQGVDRLWVTDIYAAHEAPDPTINSQLLSDQIRACAEPGHQVHYTPAVRDVPAQIAPELKPGDLVLFLGAGDIHDAAVAMADRLRRNSAGLARSWRDSLRELLSLACLVRVDEPLASHTTLRVGGRADLYLEPGSEEDLAQILRFCTTHGVPFFVLGRGSNLLVRDGGIRGVTLALKQPVFSAVTQLEPHLLNCGAGAKLKDVAHAARRAGLTGLEFLEGIPGSLGGALRMNAGAMGSWTFDRVDRVRFMDYHGEIQERPASEVYVEYRGCPLFKNHLALGAVLRGDVATPESVAGQMKRFNERRWETQPHAPSAGCIFKNPAKIPAGRLIDQLGLKGTRVGEAEVSQVHANFIVNTGGATANDVLNLIELVRQRARQNAGIELQTEVENVGDDLPAPSPCATQGATHNELN